MPWLRRDVDTSSYNLLEAERSSLVRDCDFALEVEGLLVAVFYSLSGGEIEVANITHDVVFASGSSTTLFNPGTTSYAPLSLSRGFGNYMELYGWLMQASNGHIIAARRNASIVMSKSGDPMFRWDLSNCWPTKLSSFGFDMKERVAVARLAVTLVAEAIEFVEP